MRSCASRTANSPGRAWNRSSWPRSELRNAGHSWTPRPDQRNARPAGGVGVSTWRLAGSTRPPRGSGRRSHGTALDPRLEVLDRIDDAPTKLVIGRTSAIGAVLFEGLRAGQAEKTPQPPWCADSGGPARERDRGRMESLRGVRGGLLDSSG